VEPHELTSLLTEARERTLALVEDLTGEELIGPRLDIVNPPLWEIGHVAWFQEKWVLRHRRARPPRRPDGDALYDSAAVHHDTRWDLPLPSRRDTLDYMEDVLTRARQALIENAPSEDGTYFGLLALFHEHMHAEALAYTRQTHGYRAPYRHAPATGGPLAGDVAIPGGTFRLGAGPDGSFVFDNEKWAHAVDVRPYAMARAPVTNVEYVKFVEARGYERREFWSEAGWRWRESAGARAPVYWTELGGAWVRRHFDTLVPLPPHHPILHVNAHEAEAYCRFAKRRLPTEAEWEMAAALDPGTGRKRRYPWGDEPPTPERANLDWVRGGLLPVDALPSGESAFGCRQMLGNVWEWTATDFGPYPGFVVDPYKEYSEPWFTGHRVLRGGCWTTRSALIRNTWRNFYPPHRRDVWAGFRTCAIDD